MQLFEQNIRRIRSDDSTQKRKKANEKRKKTKGTDRGFVWNGCINHGK